jgi:hypothetical protein
VLRVQYRLTIGCFLALLGILHFDEREAPRTSSVTFRHNRDAAYGAILAEELAQLVLAGMEIEISHEYVLNNVCSDS